jgi:26S proteasome regulatory subunit N11
MSDRPAGDFLEWRELPGISSEEDHHAPASIIKFFPAVLAAVQDHLSSDITKEQVGLLFGRVEETEGNPSIVTILTSHPLDPASASSTHVAMLRDQWPSAWRRLTSCKPDLQLVGWYHSHPGHGIFLSATDLRTQALWFRQPWHVALVFDPVSHSIGAFCGPQGHRTSILVPEID